MAKKITLQVPTPCNENWHSMTPANDGRFCNSCQKGVVDFSNMSDRQLLDYFAKSKVPVCGRFHQDQLNRTVQVPKRPIPFIKYFFQITLPAFLLTLKVNAQKDRLTGKVAVCNTTSKFDNKVIGDTIIVKDDDLIKGKVVDTNGVEIAHATIMVKGTKIGVVTDEHGMFALSRNEFFKKPLLISALGFQSKEAILSRDGNIILEPVEVVEIMGFVAVVPSKKQKPIPLMEMKKSKVSNNLSAFPNPAKPGNLVTLNWKNIQTGNYLVKITSVNGQEILTEKLNVDAVNGSSQLTFPSVGNGLYTINLINIKNKKVEAVLVDIQ